jgi:hypothetical protein
MKLGLESHRKALLFTCTHRRNTQSSFLAVVAISSAIASLNASRSTSAPSLLSTSSERIGPPTSRPVLLPNLGTTSGTIRGIADEVVSSVVRTGNKANFEDHFYESTATATGVNINNEIILYVFATEDIAIDRWSMLVEVERTIHQLRHQPIPDQTLNPRPASAPIVDGLRLPRSHIFAR